MPVGGLSSPIRLPLVLPSSSRSPFMTVFRAESVVCFFFVFVLFSPGSAEVHRLHWVRFQILWDLAVKLEWQRCLHDGLPQKRFSGGKFK